MWLMEYYACGNPYFEPVSLDRLAVADPDDADVLTHLIEDPAADIERSFEMMHAQKSISAFLGALRPRDRELVVRVFWLEQSQAAVAKTFLVSGAAISKRMARIPARGQIALADLRDTIMLQ